MPHVEIKCFPGRTEEQKTRCAEKIAEDIAEILGCNIFLLQKRAHPHGVFFAL